MPKSWAKHRNDRLILQSLETLSQGCMVSIAIRALTDGGMSTQVDVCRANAGRRQDTSRNLANVCTEADLQRLPPLKRVADAYGALQYLQRHPDVDADRIGVMGWSHGGSTVLTAVNRLLVEVIDCPGTAFGLRWRCTPIVSAPG